MKAVSADVLKATSQALTREISTQRRLDQSRAEGELAVRTEEIKRVLEPIGDKLEKVEGKVEQLEKLRQNPRDAWASSCVRFTTASAR